MYFLCYSIHQSLGLFKLSILQGFRFKYLEGWERIGGIQCEISRVLKVILFLRGGEGEGQHCMENVSLFVCLCKLDQLNYLVLSGDSANAVPH